MKRNLLITLSVIALFAVCAICAANVFHIATFLSFGSVRPSGQAVTKYLPVPAFDAVSASRGVKVLLAEKGEAIRIETDANLMDRVIVETDDRELKITLDPEIRNIHNMDVTVTVPVGDAEIRALKASGAAEIGSDHPLHGTEISVGASGAARVKIAAKAGKYEFEASSAAKISAEIEAGECTAEASSAARIALAGTAGKINARATSAAGIEAADLSVSQACADASSAARIEIACSGQLKASASSGARIRYTGNCEVDAETSGGGSIRKN